MLTLQVMAMSAFLFACQEKPRKEQFVVKMTNAKTKKILIGLMNQNPDPVAVVLASRPAMPGANSTPLGHIVYCNEQFEKLLSERLGMP